MMCALELGVVASLPVLMGVYLKALTPKKIKFFKPYNRPKAMITRELDPSLISHIHELSDEQKKYYFYKGAKAVFRYGTEDDFDIYATPISAKRMTRYQLKEIQKLDDCEKCSENRTSTRDDGR